MKYFLHAWSMMPQDRNGAISRDEYHHGQMYLKSPEHIEKLVQYIILDPARENCKLTKHVVSFDWTVLQPIDVQFTMQVTLQHNSLAKHHSCIKQVRHMHALVPVGIHSKVVLETIVCAT